MLPAATRRSGVSVKARPGMQQDDQGRTELDDLDQPLAGPSGVFSWVREAHPFARDRSRLRDLTRERQTIQLAPDQLYPPPVPIDAMVRLGKLRVTEFLEDGREVTRAILQAGAVFRTCARNTATPVAAGGDASHHDLADIVLTSLGEAELWLLPAGMLDQYLE